MWCVAWIHCGTPDEARTILSDAFLSDDIVFSSLLLLRLLSRFRSSWLDACYLYDIASFSVRALVPHSAAFPIFALVTTSAL